MWHRIFGAINGRNMHKINKAVALPILQNEASDQARWKVVDECK